MSLEVLCGLGHGPGQCGDPECPTRLAQAKLAELNAEYQSALEDAQGDYDEEMIDGGGAFDISISMALLYPKEVAEEFLRGQWGYVPQSYKNLLMHRSQ